ncbi:HNH endonuclease [Anaerovirgula multivorans]|uniref:HNH endonuclease n=1 Tax=Anaerovirgula multivorans TaxID=312168 RepID=A0A239CUP2_9FIRM|nr:HNH endonuclease [Anaerovirgula multivorans]SNS23830.1 HNH endonuclease [Anaerovirgula multivorans]
MAKEDICEICGSENRVRRYKKTNQCLCEKHYKQMYNKGRISDNSPKSIYERNEIIIKDNYAEIIILDSYYNLKGKCLISIDKIDLVKKHKWRINGHGYVCGILNGKEVQIQKLIMGEVEDGKEIDHVSRDKLDNRDENLRVTTRIENSQNRGIASNNTSGGLQECVGKRIEIDGELINKHLNWGYIKDLKMR